MNCLGLIRDRRRTWQLRRCARIGPYPYCHNHRWQPIIPLAFVAFTVGPALAAWLSLIGPSNNLAALEALRRDVALVIDLAAERQSGRNPHVPDEIEAHLEAHVAHSKEQHSLDPSDENLSLLNVAEATLALHRGNYQRVLEILGPSQNTGELRTEALRIKGYAYLELGIWDKAASTFDAAIDQESPHEGGGTWHAKAIAHWQGSQTELALKAIDQAIALSPESPLSHDVRGSLLASSGQPEAALREFDRAISLDPTYPGVFANKGLALLLLERWPEAEEALNRAIALEPSSDDIFMLTNLSVALLGQENYIQAISVLKRVISLSPESYQAHFNLGMAYENTGDLGRALKSYSAALDIRPDAARAAKHRDRVAKSLENLGGQ